MKFKDFQSLSLKKSEVSKILGGSSTTLYKEVGVAENEYHDDNGNGKLDPAETEGGPDFVIYL